MPGRWLTVRAASGRAAKLVCACASVSACTQLVQTGLGGRVICEDRDLLYEEAPAAYKNIEAVIQDLVDAGLVSVIATFRPLLTYKTRKLQTLSAFGHRHGGWRNRCTELRSAREQRLRVSPFLRVNDFLSVNAKQLEQPVFQAGPNRCESDHGCQFVRVAQLDQSAAVRRRRSQVQFLSWTPF